MIWSLIIFIKPLLLDIQLNGIHGVFFNIACIFMSSALKFLFYADNLAFCNTSFCYDIICQLPLNFHKIMCKKMEIMSLQTAVTKRQIKSVCFSVFSFILKQNKKYLPIVKKLRKTSHYNKVKINLKSVKAHIFQR